MLFRDQADRADRSLADRSRTMLIDVNNIGRINVTRTALKIAPRTGPP